jgi:hypothetical protein
MQVLNRASILFALSNQKLGFEFGKPERVNEESLSVVLPILRHSVTPRTYTTFPETEALKVKDSGSIDTMKAKNEGELSIFLRSGTIFKGSTQERASLRSMIVLPGQEVDVKVRCIHASRGITRDAAVKYGGSIPLMMEQMSYGSNFAPQDQGKYWQNVQTVSASMNMATGGEQTGNVNQAEQYRHQTIRTASPFLRSQAYTGVISDQALGGLYVTQSLDGGTLGAGADDLHSQFADFSKSFDDVLSKVNLVDDQVGLGLITERGCETIELFDAHDSWKGLHGDAVKRLGPNMASKDKASVFEYKPEKAIEVVQAVLALPFEEKVIYEHKPNNGDPAFSVVSLSAKDYTGEVVEFDGKVIHMLLLKMGVA